MRILYQGLLRSPASWARVGRGYLEGLARLGHPVEAISPRGFLHDERFPISAEIVEVRLADVRAAPPPEIGLGFLHPPNLGRLVGRLRANLFVWESDQLPPGWAGLLKEGTDLVIVPSEFTRQALIGAAFPPERAIVVPYGFDESLLEIAPPHAGASDHPFTFLAVIAPHWRKGVAQLLEAFRSAFSSRDEVLLRIKSAYDPGVSRGRQSFEIPSWAAALEAARLAEPGAPRVELDVRVVPDAAIPALHANADVVVAPTWGESFGLSILEGLASARPVIATAWSGHMDFFPAGPDAVGYRLVEAGDRLYQKAPGGKLALPDVDALAERMRWHYLHREASRALGIDSRSRVAGLTWLNAARTLAGALAARVTSAGDRTA